MASLALAFDILARDKASADLNKIGDSADRTGKKVSGLGSTFAGMGKAVALGAAALGVGAVALGKGFYDAAIESQKVTKQTEAVIKSMGLTSTVSAKQVGDLAGSLAMKTGVDDELIQSGQNVLLTFGELAKSAGQQDGAFNRATKAALDMSVALGTDMSSASMMVGKALNDPIDGLSKLARSGIQFSDQQKEQIKTMQEAGDMAGAQAIMLGELERQFGGSAEAQATAGDRLKVVWGNLQEQIGEKLVPVIETLAKFLADNLPKAMATLGRVVGPIAKQIGMFFNTLKTGFTEDEGTPVERFALKVRDVFGQVADVAKEWGPVVLDALRQVASFITETVLPGLVDLGRWVIEHKPVLIGLGVAIATGLVASFVAWAAAAGAAALATIAATAPVIAVGAAIAAVVAGLVYAYTEWDTFRTAVDHVANGFTILGETVATVWAGITEGVTIGVRGVVDLFLGMAENIVGAAAAAFSWVPGLGGKLDDAKAAVDRFRDDVNAALGGIKDQEISIKFVRSDFVGPLMKGQTRLPAGFIGPVQVGRNANGTDYWPGGLSWVGEKGPELVNLPRGSQVIPNRESLAMAGASQTNHFTIVAPDVENGLIAASRVMRRAAVEVAGA